MGNLCRVYCHGVLSRRADAGRVDFRERLQAQAAPQRLQVVGQRARELQALASLEIANEQGTLRPVKASGQLSYDACSNLAVRGVIEAACGRRDAARAHWESVLKTEAPAASRATM